MLHGFIIDSKIMEMVLIYFKPIYMLYKIFK